MLKSYHWIMLSIPDNYLALFFVTVINYMCIPANAHTVLKKLQVTCTYKLSYIFRQVFAIFSATTFLVMHCVQFVTI